MRYSVHIVVRKLLGTSMHDFGQGLAGHEGVNQVTAQTVGQLAQLTKRDALIRF
jgi:hypothetical protein